MIYHSCIRNGFFDLDSLETIRSGPTRVVQGAEVPDISWTTQFAELAAPFRNVYAELGTTFAGSVVTFPTVWSQIPNSLLTLLEYRGQANDNFSKMRKQYVEMGGGRSNTRYGWIRRA